MTTLPAILSERANQCRDESGFACPFASLLPFLQSQVFFDRLTGLAMWLKEGDGHEPPPYWRDENGYIHNL